MHAQTKFSTTILHHSVDTSPEKGSTSRDTKDPLVDPNKTGKSNISAEAAFEDTTLRILRTLGTYSVGQDNDQSARSVAAFAQCIDGHVRSRSPIPMVLPAFPYKSINRIDKCFGAEPDFGDEIALCRLDNLCQDIRKIYAPGATICIVNDGLCYNDLIGARDEECWVYESELRALAADRGLACLMFCSMVNLFDLCEELPISKRTYLSLCDSTRKQLMLKYGEPNFDISKFLSEDEDHLMTYRGYCKFFGKELEYHPAVQKLSSRTARNNYAKSAAKQVIERGAAFAKVIRTTFPDHVRLSIHPSSGKAKIYIPLIPQESFSMTPWHSVVAVDARGRFRTAHYSEFRDTHELVFKSGKKWYFREKSPLFEWDAEVEFVHGYGTSLIIKRIGSCPQALSDSDKEKLVALAMNHRAIELQGFES